jgi:hypothetical protein
MVALFPPTWLLAVEGLEAQWSEQRLMAPWRLLTIPGPRFGRCSLAFCSLSFSLDLTSESKRCVEINSRLDARLGRGSGHHCGLKDPLYSSGPSFYLKRNKKKKREMLWGSGWGCSDLFGSVPFLFS